MDTLEQYILPNIVNLYESDVINTCKYSSLYMNLRKDYSIDLKNKNIIKYIYRDNIPYPMIVDYISSTQINVARFSENPSDSIRFHQIFSF